MRFTVKRKLVTIFSGLITGLIGYLFLLTNILNNQDNLHFMHGYGIGITSGRWLLTLLGDTMETIFGNLNLQTFNNILCICILAVAAYIIVLIFDLHDLLHCGIWSAMFISFPSIGDTLLFSFTSHYYAAAILMTVTGVYLTIKYKFGFLAGAFLAACSLGIYQAYFPLMIGLFLTLLIIRSISEDSTFISLLKSGFLYLGTLILGLIDYFILLRISLFACNSSLSNYQNISSMGKLDIREIPKILSSAYKSFLKIPFDDYCDMGASNNWIIRVMLYILIIASFYMLVLIIRKRKEVFKQTRWLFLVLILLYPLAISSIILMCYHAYIHTLMIYGIVLIYLMPVALCEQGCLGEDKPLSPNRAKWCKKTVAAALIIITLIYYRQNNASYSLLYYANQQSYNYWNSLVTQIKNTEGFRADMPWAIIGSVDDPLYNNPWDEYVEQYGAIPANQLNMITRRNYVEQFLGYHPVYAEGFEILKIKTSSYYKKMPCYPDYGSIRIENNTVVVKFS